MSHQFKIERKRIGKGFKWIVGRVRAKAGEEIEWSSDKTDFRIWFPPDRNPLAPGSSESDKRGKVTRKVKGTAEKGIYYYTVFCYKDNTMAEGGTSPKMIIE